MTFEEIINQNDAINKLRPFYSKENGMNGYLQFTPNCKLIQIYKNKELGTIMVKDPTFYHSDFTQIDDWDFVDPVVFNKLF